MAVRCPLVNHCYFGSGILCYIGYIVLPLSQIRAEIGRQHWQPALLSTHPSCQLGIVTAAAAVTCIASSVWWGFGSQSLRTAFGGCGACPQCHYIIGGSSRGDWPCQCSFRVLPCNVLLRTREFSCAHGLCLLLGPSGLFSGDGKSSSQSAPQPWQMPFQNRTWEQAWEEHCMVLANLLS